MGILVASPTGGASVCARPSSRYASASRCCCSRRATEDPPVAAPSTSSPIPPLTPGSPTASPTPPALPIVPPPTGGPPTGTCDQGWDTPKAGTPEFTEPLGIIRRTTGVKGPLVVVDMRHFVGPESPPSDKGYLLDIERWYIKLYAQDDIAFQGRFLVESRTFGRGLSAVAPYDTEGFVRRTGWGSSSTACPPRRRATRDCPASGRAPLTTSFAGERASRFRAADEVLGCLAGT